MKFFHKTKKIFCLFLLFPLFFAVSGFCFYFVFNPANAMAMADGMKTDSGCAIEKIKEKSKNSIKACCFAQERDAEYVSLFIFAPVLTASKSDFQTNSCLKKSVNFSSAVLTPPQKEKLDSIIKRE